MLAGTHFHSTGLSLKKVRAFPFEFEETSRDMLTEREWRNRKRSRNHKRERLRSILESSTRELRHDLSPRWKVLSVEKQRRPVLD